MKKGWLVLWVSVLICSMFSLAGAMGEQATEEGPALPVLVPPSPEFTPIPHASITNLITVDQLHAAIKHAAGKLFLDLNTIKDLLDGTRDMAPGSLYGRLCIGPYPFEEKETTYDYKRYRICTHDRASVFEIPVDTFLKTRKNSEDWTDEGVVALRVDLTLASSARDRAIGVYDTFLRFKRTDKGLAALPVITEGPLVGIVTSDDPTKAVISFKTSAPVAASITLGGKTFTGSKVPQTGHEITVNGITPGKMNDYTLAFDGYERTYTLKAAPKKGQGEVKIAYTGDSREGQGGGDYEFMGVNYRSIEKIFNQAFQMDADAFLFGGDLINGYTTEQDDFLMQLHAWKQAAVGFGSSRPIYSVMGNHEALVATYKHPKLGGVILDRWPYHTESAEATFAHEFANPTNGPLPSDPRRPQYEESVYAVQTGAVLSIAFNNNYWISSHPDRLGGSPEGFLFDDQLAWIEKQLKRAEKDPTIRFIILFAQEPVFPNGGHIGDAMWYRGNNDVRAYATDVKTGTLKPEKKGMIDVRNELVTMIAASSKVAAVLTSDEHSYHRTLIDNKVPVGDPKKDLKTGKRRLCEGDGNCSSLKQLKHGVYYITSGGGGAPYYSEESTPWNAYHKKSGNTCAPKGQASTYCYSSQENFLLFETRGNAISLTVHNLYGDVIDRVDNLMGVK